MITMPDFEDISDNDLVASAQQGSRTALETLIARYQRWIFNIAVRMVGSVDDAEDVTQEILIKMITKLSNFEGKSRFRTWLYRITANHVMNMVKIVNARKRACDPVTKLFNTYVFPGILYSALYPMIPSMDKDFWVNDRCNGCGNCVGLCPVRNITLNAGKPTWQHHCEQCWACVHWCPKAAIEYGKKTANKARYHHPDVSFADLKLQAGTV